MMSTEEHVASPFRVSAFWCNIGVLLARLKEKLVTLRRPSSPTNMPMTSLPTKHGHRPIYVILYGSLILAFESGFVYKVSFQKMKSLGIDPLLILIPIDIFVLCYYVAMYWLSDRCRHVPCRCLGSVGKLVAEVINFSIVMVLRQFCNLDFFLLFMGFTAELQVVAWVMHLAYDVGIRDVSLGLSMQLLVYVTSGNSYWSSVVCCLFAVLTLFRYLLYAPPAIPFDNKKEEDCMPC